jgi:hypothetical protein
MGMEPIKVLSALPQVPADRPSFFDQVKRSTRTKLVSSQQKSPAKLALPIELGFDSVISGWPSGALD